MTKTLRDQGVIGIFINQAVEERRELERMVLDGELSADLGTTAIDLISRRETDLRIEYAAAADRAGACFSGPVR